MACHSLVENRDFLRVGIVRQRKLAPLKQPDARRFKILGPDPICACPLISLVGGYPTNLSPLTPLPSFAKVSLKETLAAWTPGRASTRRSNATITFTHSGRYSRWEPSCGSASGRGHPASIGGELQMARTSTYRIADTIKLTLAGGFPTRN
jgi:hypothetical protein